MSEHTRTAPVSAAETFERHRPVMTGVAYRMLGRFADAEDVVQEAWLRWADTDRSRVREPRAFLVRTTTRLAIDRLRHVQSRHEAYVGEWLPEPLTTDGEPGAESRVLLAETVSLAMLVLLESLTPLERAVFVLREAFGYPYGEIAAILDRAEPAVRQLAGRARRHVEAREQRFDADPEVSARLTERFLAACTGGDLEGLLALLAPDVRLIGDGGECRRRRCASSRPRPTSGASCTPSPTTRRPPWPSPSARSTGRRRSSSPRTAGRTPWCPWRSGTAGSPASTC